jgi:hypothetical protein
MAIAQVTTLTLLFGCANDKADQKKQHRNYRYCHNNHNSLF